MGRRNRSRGGEGGREGDRRGGGTGRRRSEGGEEAKGGTSTVFHAVGDEVWAGCQVGYKPSHPCPQSGPRVARLVLNVARRCHRVTET